jgi:ankyrin repeat protein
VHLRDHRQRTPLHVSARTRGLRVASLLIGAGSAVDARDADGETALVAAAAAGSLPIVQALLAAGADRGLADAAGGVWLGVLALVTGWGCWRS